MPSAGVSSLAQLLYRASELSSGIIIYEDSEEVTSNFIPYRKLLKVAERKANQLKSMPNAYRGTVVFLHLESFQQIMEWFWAAILAGLLPAVSTPLSADRSLNRMHLTHVCDTLKHPIILTTRNLASDFEGVNCIDLNVVEHLNKVDTDLKSEQPKENEQSCSGESAFLMLTSGSSGNAKAVVLRHDQIIASVKGKSKFFETTRADIFLNWIGFDHVASVIETHIQAMYLGANLIHVPAPRLMMDPSVFLRLIERHQVSYTFAPHFFLARLQQSLQNSASNQTVFNLSCLRHLVSGGESNVVETALALTKTLQNYKVEGEVIRPGFGMTETCAGSIYGNGCPSYDITQGNIFTSLGKSISGIRMRIMNITGSEASTGEIGDLQVSGPIVFREYFNNYKATATSFTGDGWFITGDRAYIDANGNLNIAGRENELINLNGVKYFPAEIESALEKANISGIKPSSTVVFSSRPPKSHTEELCIVYSPTFSLEDIFSRVETASKIINVVGMATSSRPKHIMPLPEIFFHKSALGKLSRAKIRTSFENGLYVCYEDSKDISVKGFKAAHREQPTNPTESAILAALRDIVDVPEEDLGVNNSIFEFGVGSTDIFTLKKRIEKDLGLSNSIPVGMLLTSPTIRGIARELDKLGQPCEKYEPVVPLRSGLNSCKIPLWLVHPGSGDVLVFVGLARYFPDRAVYGLRTRGLNTGVDGNNYFDSIAAIVDCYVGNIKRYQFRGPYAIAGYSLGSTVAFEIAKRLEVMGDKVAFLGMLDSPPHIRCLIEQLDWVDVLLNVAYFLELISEKDSSIVNAELRQRSPNQALDFIISCAPQKRLEALAMDKKRLHKITDVTSAFGEAGKNYDPEGSVRGMDVFWVTPLRSVAKSRKEWMDKHLVRWQDFSTEEPRFHECEGMHSKMLNAEYVNSVQKSLRRAMGARGV